VEKPEKESQIGDLTLQKVGTLRLSYICSVNQRGRALKNAEEADRGYGLPIFKHEHLKAARPRGKSGKRMGPGGKRRSRPLFLP